MCVLFLKVAVILSKAEVLEMFLKSANTMEK